MKPIPLRKSPWDHPFIYTEGVEEEKMTGRSGKYYSKTLVTQAVKKLQNEGEVKLCKH